MTAYASSLELKARRATGAGGSDVSLAIAQYLTDIGVQTEAIFMESGRLAASS